MTPITQASRAYQHLRDKLISGDFAPGARLLYGPIGKEIGVSATPVREAAGRLANEGLVDLVPNLGAVVRRLERTELIEIYEVRLAIEGYASGLAAERAGAAQRQEIGDCLQRMDALAAQQNNSSGRFAEKETRSQFDQADYRFHMAVIEATGNRAMIRTAGQSHVLTRIFGVRRHQYDSSNMLTTCQEHRAILQAIDGRNARLATEAAIAHIRHGLELSLQSIEGEAAGAE